MSRIINSVKKFKLKKLQLIGLLIFFVCALMHPFIANEKYVICFDGEDKFMASPEDCTSGIRGLIPYSSKSIDKANRAVGPFDTQKAGSFYYRHWLGTDLLGRDILAGIIWGSYIALRIGILAMLLTILIGTFFGFISGYVGNNGMRIKPLLLFISCLIFTICVFYFWYGGFVVKSISTLCIVGTIAFTIRQSESESYSSNLISIPFDLIVMRFIEIFRSIPDIFLILVLIGIAGQPSITNVIFIIAIVRWPSVARFVRAEILKTKEEQFVESARALGLSSFKVFKDHILPISISPVIIASAFGVSTAILLESTLSFLGIGIPPDQVTWGSMLNAARQNFSLWWLAVFPGLMIYLTIFLFNSLGDTVSEYYNS